MNPKGASDSLIDGDEPVAAPGGATPTPREFEASLLAHLHKLCATEVGLDTNLFTTGLINSLKFIELMLFVETSLGIRVPSSRLSAEYFKSPRVIVETFCASKPG